ncbi:phosphotransferase [Kitasatospora sp. NPDC017646]|uniref:phosphotransferase n=1 Tax=Kitasatospora sp. NPDC017646 TaxID=3364024 RepID=UPI0037B4417B
MAGPDRRTDRRTRTAQGQTHRLHRLRLPLAHPLRPLQRRRPGRPGRPRRPLPAHPRPGHRPGTRPGGRPGERPDGRPARPRPQGRHALKSLSAATRRSLLHTEFMREHLIADPDGRWRLTGLIDFEPAMIGDPAYDLVAVGLFTTRADPHLLGRLLTAYGRPFEPRLLMAYTLLHVYGDLPWYLEELEPSARTPEDLAPEWFGIA